MRPPNRPITELTVHIAATCSDIFGEVYVRVRSRAGAYAEPDSTQKHKSGLMLLCKAKFVNKELFANIAHVQQGAK